MIGEKIRKLRDSRDWTTRTLAEKLNISHVTITAYEKGRAKPRMKIIEKLAEIFNVSISELTETETSTNSGRKFDPIAWQHKIQEADKLDQKSKLYIMESIDICLDRKKVADQYRLLGKDILTT